MKTKLFSGIKKAAGIALSLLALSTGAQAQSSGIVYFSSGSPTQLYRINNPGFAGTTTATPVGSATVTYNGIGYRISDGQLYAGTNTGSVVRINPATGAVANTGISLGSYVVIGGDVAGNMMYATLGSANGVNFLAINLNTGSVTPYSIPNFYIADLAYNAADGRLYGYRPSQNAIVSIDPANPTVVTTYNAAAFGAGGVASVWSDANGIIHFDRRGSFNPITHVVTANAAEGTAGTGGAGSGNDDGAWAAVATPLTNGGAIAAPQNNCGAFDPAPVTETVPASGGCCAAIEYRWWANGSIIAGATNATYDPGMISVTTTYQREARRGTTAWVASNAVTMTVYDCQLTNGGTIAAPQSSCGAFDPAALTETAPASGGNGVDPIEYRWWANGSIIAGATGASYDPGYITTTSTYQREARRGNTNWVASNAVTMTVNAVPVVNISANPVTGPGNAVYEGTIVTLTANGADTYTWSDGATGTPHDVTATMTTRTLTVTGTNAAGCSANAAITVYGKPRPLPVIFSSFETRQDGCKADLSWITETEINNDHYEIERKTDKGFTKVGEVKAGHHEGRQQYSFTDEQPANGLNQYRIVQVDADGKRTSTGIKVLNFNCGDDAVQVYPTVTNGAVTVKLPATYNQADIHVFNSMGQMIAVNGAGKAKAAGSHTLQFEGLARGQYIIHIVNGTNKQVFKVILR